MDCLFRRNGRDRNAIRRGGGSVLGLGNLARGDAFKHGRDGCCGRRSHRDDRNCPADARALRHKRRGAHPRNHHRRARTSSSDLRRSDGRTRGHPKLGNTTDGRGSRRRRRHSVGSSAAGSRSPQHHPRPKRDRARRRESGSRSPQHRPRPKRDRVRRRGAGQRIWAHNRRNPPAGGGCWGHHHPGGGHGSAWSCCPSDSTGWINSSICDVDSGGFWIADARGDDDCSRIGVTCCRWHSCDWRCSGWGGVWCIGRTFGGWRSGRTCDRWCGSCFRGGCSGCAGRGQSGQSCGVLGSACRSCGFPDGGWGAGVWVSDVGCAVGCCSANSFPGGSSYGFGSPGFAGGAGCSCVRRGGAAPGCARRPSGAGWRGRICWRRPGPRCLCPGC